MKKRPDPDFERQREGAREWMNRPWAEMAEMKARYWAELHEKDPDAISRLSLSLWGVSHRAGLHDDPEHRAEDLRAHIALRRLLDRARRAAEKRGRAR